MKTNVFDGLSCRCGKRFRSYQAEARHRHNFPVLCKAPKLRIPSRIFGGGPVKRKVRTKYGSRGYPL